MRSVKLALIIAVTLTVGTLRIEAQANPVVRKESAPSKAAASTDSNKLKVDLDTTGIAKTTKVEIVPKDAYDPQEEIIHLNGAPMHVRIIFDGQKIESDNDFNKPHLLVYPLPQYEAMFPTTKKAAFNKRINVLKKVIATKSDIGVDELPILPESDGHEFLRQQEKYLSFNKGTGVSFVSVYGNGDGPFSAGDFFYTFQGITTDGKHYVSFFWPVKATGMPANSNEANTKKYLQKLDRTKFSPSLSALDQVVSSITIK
jgi:hypothetical protein